MGLSVQVSGACYVVVVVGGLAGVFQSQFGSTVVLLICICGDSPEGVGTSTVPILTSTVPMLPSISRVKRVLCVNSCALACIACVGA